jgi:hypothetical protein
MGGGISRICLKYLYGWCDYLVVGDWLGLRAAAGGLVEQVAEHVSWQLRELLGGEGGGGVPVSV